MAEIKRRAATVEGAMPVQAEPRVEPQSDELPTVRFVYDGTQKKLPTIPWRSTRNREVGGNFIPGECKTMTVDQDMQIVIRPMDPDYADKVKAMRTYVKNYGVPGGVKFKFRELPAIPAR